MGNCCKIFKKTKKASNENDGKDNEDEQEDTHIEVIDLNGGSSIFEPKKRGARDLDTTQIFNFVAETIDLQRVSLDVPGTETVGSIKIMIREKLSLEKIDLFVDGRQLIDHSQLLDCNVAGDKIVDIIEV